MAIDDNLNASLIAKYLREGNLSPEDMAQYERNALQMETPNLQKYNLANANAQGGTPESRAGNLGFDTPVYHGTNADINAFDPSLSSAGAAKGPGIYVTERPDDASRWAGNNIDSNVMPLVVNKSNVLPLSELNKNDALKLSKFLGRNLNDGDSWPGFSLENRGNLSDSTKNAGFSGADHAGPSASRYIKDTVINDPSIIRSKFAAFDPLRKNSSSLLASTLLPAALGYGMYSQESENKTLAEILRGK